MYVQRYEWRVKPVHWPEAVPLVKEGLGCPGCPQVKRLYMPATGEGCVLAAEWEWGSLADYEKVWDAFYVSPAWAEFGKKWFGILDGFTEQIWNVVPM